MSTVPTEDFLMAISINTIRPSDKTNIIKIKSHIVIESFDELYNGTQVCLEIDCLGSPVINLIAKGACKLLLTPLCKVNV